MIRDVIVGVLKNLGVGVAYFEALIPCLLWGFKCMWFMKALYCGLVCC